MSRKHSPSPNAGCGAVDVLYVPSPGKDERCRQSVESVVNQIEASGVRQVFITGCKDWICERRIYCDESAFEDILPFTIRYPRQFTALAAYNPFDIGPSIREAEIGIEQYGFCGIYLHPAGFGLRLIDHRIYPAFVKGLDWKVPVLVDARALPGEIAAPSPHDVEQVALDLPELQLVVAQTEWERSELDRLGDSCPNIAFCLDGEYLSRPEILDFAATTGSARVMWGSCGQPWKEALDTILRVGLPEPQHFLSRNATRIFRLNVVKPRARHYSQHFAPIARVAAE